MSAPSSSPTRPARLRPSNRPVFPRPWPTTPWSPKGAMALISSPPTVVSVRCGRRPRRTSCSPIAFPPGGESCQLSRGGCRGCGDARTDWRQFFHLQRLVPPDGRMVHDMQLMQVATSERAPGGRVRLSEDRPHRSRNRGVPPAVAQRVPDGAEVSRRAGNPNGAGSTPPRCPQAGRT